MVELLEIIEENRPKTTGNNQTDIQRDNEYHELLLQFKKIK
jgi:hypothetical protein